MKCGTGLTLTCAKCNTELPTGAAFCIACGQSATAARGQQRYTPPDTYTPKHLAEKILTSKAALEGERKQVTVLFADLKGSMELLADRDPEEARKLLDPVIEHMMEAVLEIIKKKVSAKHYQMFYLHVCKEIPAKTVARKLDMKLAEVYFAKYKVALLVRKELKRLEMSIV
jgi:hypothetical protein